MTECDFWRIYTLALLCGLQLQFAEPSLLDTRPNVLLIVIDDLAVSAVSTYKVHLSKLWICFSLVLDYFLCSHKT